MPDDGSILGYLSVALARGNNGRYSPKAESKSIKVVVTYVSSKKMEEKLYSIREKVGF